MRELPSGELIPLTGPTPTDEEVVRYTLRRIFVNGSRTSPRNLGDELLVELGLRLVQADDDRAAIWEWLTARTGGGCGRSSFYRFCETFRKHYLAAWHEFRDPGALSDPPVYTVREVAAMLRIKPETARDLVNSGRLPAVRIGKTIRVPSAAVRRFLHAANAVQEGVEGASKGRKSASGMRPASGIDPS